MRTPTIGLALEGVPILFLASLATLVFGLLGLKWLALVGLAFTGFSLHFFRDPERVTPPESGLAVSPADGAIVQVGPAEDPLDGVQRTRICVFMNVFNVHVNRAPVAGQVAAIRYWPGLFFNASLDKASTDNERLALRIVDNEGQPWTAVQIAGLIARRIVCRAEIGDALERGQRFGLIKFGSRVDLYLPEGYASAVNVGDKVFAGQTVLARKIDRG
jgi:phosphatidylserine decarboxylase